MRTDRSGRQSAHLFNYQKVVAGKNLEQNIEPPAGRHRGRAVVFRQTCVILACAAATAASAQTPPTTDADRDRDDLDRDDLDDEFAAA